MSPDEYARTLITLALQGVSGAGDAGAMCREALQREDGGAVLFELLELAALGYQQLALQLGRPVGEVWSEIAADLAAGGDETIR